jgi:OTU domain-containing protein 3
VFTLSTQALADPASNTHLLTEQLRALGLYAASTLGDGNCLFRALSDQLYGSDSYHSKLRQDVCTWISNHQRRYEPFVDDERGLDVHLQCMRQQGEPHIDRPSDKNTYIDLHF